jgi:hypothetical protein|nr:MAG TPA: hypothetical protein [Caudoviricetes sp.]
MTNWDHYFGTPEKAARMEVRFDILPSMVSVYKVGRCSDQMVSLRVVAKDMMPDEYRAWLDAEYDDGTIVFED